VLISCWVFRLPSGQPPICTGDQPFGLAFRPTSDFHRRSIFRRYLPTQPPTLIVCQIFRPSFRSISGLRLRPTFRQPSSQSQAFAFDRLSGSTLRSTVDLRLRSTFRFRLCIDLRLAPPADPPTDYPTDLQLALKINPPAKPSSRPSTCVSDQPSGSALCIDLRLAPPADPRACLPTDLQLAPSNQSSSSAFQPTYLTCVSWSTFRLCLKPNLRLSSAVASSGCLPTDLRLAPPTDLPAPPPRRPQTFAWDRLFGFRLPFGLRLSPAANLPASPSNTTSDSHRLLHPSALLSG